METKSKIIISLWIATLLVAIDLAIYIKHDEKVSDTPPQTNTQEAQTIRVVVEHPVAQMSPSYQVTPSEERSRPPLSYYHGEYVYHVDEVGAEFGGREIPIYAKINGTQVSNSCMVYHLTDVDSRKMMHATISDGVIYENPDREKLLREAARTGEAIYVYGRIITFDNGNSTFETKKVFRKEEVIK